ncbi:MAG: glycosyltransferase [Patescibacteria group bacterium]
MKDLRIVLVSWNIADLLGKCLAALPAACGDLEWECVVVDNVSSDSSVDIAIAAAAKDGRFRLIQNQSNLGFAKACNIGAKGTDSRYVLFLNTDTECPAQSLEKLVRRADELPRAGILGPKLVYPDGRKQPSVRRFPGFWDQLAIIFKLQHIFPRLGVLKRYFAEDLDSETEQNVDQVMGACFLVRRELIDRGLGYDERYFVWMEEVDFCKEAKKDGWDIVYVPSVTVMHHLGQSFAKEIQLRRQRYFLTSLKKYFDKWHPGLPALGIKIAAPFGMAAVWALNILQKPTARWLVGILALEIVSYFVYAHATLNSAMALVLAAVVTFLAWRKPYLALGMLLCELMIGSMGHLFDLSFSGHAISIRVLFFIALFVGWVVNFLQYGSFNELLKSLKSRWTYGLLGILVVYGLVRGWLVGNSDFLLADANAWVFLVLLVPVVDISRRYASELKRIIVPALFAGLIWSAFETLAVEYVFAHNLAWSEALYTWIRKTGVGEITRAGRGVWRVFFQSHVFIVAALIVSVAWWLGNARNAKKEKRSINWRLMAVCGSVVLIGMSRSFWMGTAAGLIAVIGAYFAKQKKTIFRARLFSLPLAALASIVLTVAVLLFPLPPVKFGDFSQAWTSRANLDEAAAKSRWQLLPKMWEKIMEYPVLGSGFGATVTYESKDPRVIQTTGGIYRTYAFEWGWLEHWIKFGVLGIPVILVLLMNLAWRIKKTDLDDWLKIGSIAALVTLGVLHVFTPYLNHPLGFSLLLLGEGLIEVRRKTG